MHIATHINIVKGLVVMLRAAATKLLLQQKHIHSKALLYRACLTIIVIHHDASSKAAYRAKHFRRKQIEQNIAYKDAIEG